MFGCDLVKGLSGYDERKQRGEYIDGMASCVSFFFTYFCLWFVPSLSALIMLRK